MVRHRTLGNGWRWAHLALLGLLCALLGQRADAQSPAQPLLHEFLPPDTQEDLALETTAAAGKLPAAIRTPSGTITPPDVSREPEPSRIYREQAAEEPGFRPDRDTRRPEVEHYDDPFSPSLTPFKRLYAFDAVRDDYTLYVRGSGTRPGDRPYRPVPVASPDEATDRRGDERFFGDMSVDLVAGQYVRIPTIGPDARLLRLLAIPSFELSVWRDGADNWFVHSDQSGRVRLVSELGIARETFGSMFADVSWSELPRVPAQPAAHQAAYQTVAQAVGISRARPPSETLGRMVAYFRSFEASDEPPREHGDIYLDLALSRKGVCRHRAFAFMVTALHLGIPTRFVHNEAHAWVEVNDGRLWHRIDLGGAATNLEEQLHPERPPHLPPPDPYAWPLGRDSGEQLAQRTRQASLEELTRQSPEPTPRTAPQDPGAARQTPAPNGEPAPADTSTGSEPAPHRPTSILTIDSLDHDVFRGLPLHVQGRVRAGTKSCAGVRVDVLVLVGPAKTERRVGSLSTDEQGVYDGAVVLPRDLPIGDHELAVATAGNAECGPGQGL